MPVIAGVKLGTAAAGAALGRIQTVANVGEVAAAMDTAVEGGPRILTPSTMITDAPTTFWSRADCSGAILPSS